MSLQTRAVWLQRNWDQRLGFWLVFTYISNEIVLSDVTNRFSEMFVPRIALYYLLIKQELSHFNFLLSPVPVYSGFMSFLLINTESTFR